jgi:hypothetical protein
LVLLAVVTFMAGVSTTAIATASASAPTSAGAAFRAPKTGYVVYWDQNEEEDYYASATGAQGQLFPAWDSNGQMCLLNDGTGRWAVGYNPTNPGQHNPGGPPNKPFKQPPVGEELISRTGVWTGTNLSVPGPYRMGSRGPGQDSPAVKGEFNGQSTYTGCAVDPRHNVFGNDIATAQGDFPIPTSGRLVEWFAPSYTKSCILYGPTQGGLGDHHVDGTGGLVQPGMMATRPDGNLLLAEGGSPSGGLGGQVLEFDHSSLPQRPRDCPGGVYPREKLRTSVFFQGTSDVLPVPSGIARDPTCRCWAIGSIIGSPAVVWVDDHGQPLASRPTLPGETIARLGQAPGYNPFGLAFAPDGTLYFVDIHITCRGPGLVGCGPQTAHGQVLRVSFQPGGQPNPPQVLAGGFDFPVSATICVEGGHQICPFPTHPTPPPRAASAGGTAG